MRQGRALNPVVALVWVLAFVPAFGAEPLNYMAQSAVDPIALLPPPPAAGSEETKAELDLIVRLQRARTPKQVERVKSDAKLDMKVFSPAIGQWFASENLPLTKQLLKKAEKDSKYYSEAAKTAFGRKRPKDHDKRVKVVIEGQEEASYPSGHAMRGTIMAAILAEILPENQEAIMTKGWELGWDRVIAGVHYPSDVVAGRVLGKAIARAMFENPAFKQDLAGAKSECNEARKRFAKK